MSAPVPSGPSAKADVAEIPATTVPKAVDAPPASDGVKRRTTKRVASDQ